MTTKGWRCEKLTAHSTASALDVPSFLAAVWEVEAAVEELLLPKYRLSEERAVAAVVMAAVCFGRP